MWIRPPPLMSSATEARQRSSGHAPANRLTNAVCCRTVVVRSFLNGPIPSGLVPPSRSSTRSRQCWSARFVRRRRGTSDWCAFSPVEPPSPFLLSLRLVGLVSPMPNSGLPKNVPSAKGISKRALWAAEVSYPPSALTMQPLTLSRRGSCLVGRVRRDYARWYA